jgi:RNA polymerase sigma factor (sigma-70 family)
MKRIMTREEFDAWARLPHSIVRRRYWWAYSHGAYQTSLYGVKLDYDDLVSEGNLALIEAWSLYDDEKFNGKRRASFQTYAYVGICNQINRYITRQLVLAGGVVENDLNNKTSRVKMFSDLMFQSELSEWERLRDVNNDDPAVTMEHEEWVKHCMDRLRKKLGKRRTKVLMRWFNGATLRQVGQTLGVTGEWARMLLNDWAVRATAILADLEEDSWEK